MLEKVVRLLQDHLFAWVKFPNEAKMRQFADMVQLQEPAVSDIIGFMDGVSFPVKCKDKCIEQNAFYCGCDCETTVNNDFAYGPDGKVFFCAINCPGSWADGSLTAHFLHHLNSLTAKSILVGEKLVLFGRYVLNFYVGIVHYILREPKTWRAKIYLPTQCTNRQILTSTKRYNFDPLLTSLMQQAL
jgi:hypothetical protein